MLSYCIEFTYLVIGIMMSDGTNSFPHEMKTIHLLLILQNSTQTTWKTRWEVKAKAALISEAIRTAAMF